MLGLSNQKNVNLSQENTWGLSAICSDSEGEVLIAAT